MTGEAVLICHLRPARKRARALAELEALALLDCLGAQRLTGGPLSEQGGVFWLSLPEAVLAAATRLLPRLGYTEAVDLVGGPDLGRDSGPLVRWRGRDYGLHRLYEEDRELARDAAPDRRRFLVRVRGDLREVRGYRGDGAPLSRRGLPRYDARLLVNLAAACPGGRILDPFAGIGGIVIAAAAAGLEALSGDADPWLADGLARLSGGRHAVLDAAALPFAGGSIDAVATEPPFGAEADAAVVESLGEISRVLRPGGRCALMCSARQAPMAACAAGRAGLALLNSAPLDRKGTACTVFLWEKS